MPTRCRPYTLVCSMISAVPREALLELQPAVQALQNEAELLSLSSSLAQQLLAHRQRAALLSGAGRQQLATPGSLPSSRAPGRRSRSSHYSPWLLKSAGPACAAGVQLRCMPAGSMGPDGCVL